jgi:hypothetical protein
MHAENLFSLACARGSGDEVIPRSRDDGKSVLWKYTVRNCVTALH